LLIRKVKGGPDLGGDVLHGLHNLLAQRGLPWIGRVEIAETLFTICPWWMVRSRAPASAHIIIDTEAGEALWFSSAGNQLISTLPSARI
jgi:hypothetical protein